MLRRPLKPSALASPASHITAGDLPRIKGLYITIFRGKHDDLVGDHDAQPVSSFIGCVGRVGSRSALFASPHRIPGCPVTRPMSTRPPYTRPPYPESRSRRDR